MIRISAMKEIAKSFERRKELKRIEVANDNNQTLLEEHISFWNSMEHRVEQLRIANNLKSKGKNVLMEKFLTIGGIRCRPDICFFEDGRWNIIEVEYCHSNKNKILRNYEELSKVANIQVIDI
jgi:hypothetical protein